MYVYVSLCGRKKDCKDDNKLEWRNNLRSSRSTIGNLPGWRNGRNNHRKRLESQESDSVEFCNDKLSTLGVSLNIGENVQCSKGSESAGYKKDKTRNLRTTNFVLAKCGTKI